MNPVLLKCIAGAGLLQQISARDEGARMRIQLRDGFFHDTVVIRSGMKVLARRTGVTSPRAVEADGPTTKKKTFKIQMKIQTQIIFQEIIIIQIIIIIT